MEPTTVAIIDSLQAYIFSAYPALYCNPPVHCLDTQSPGPPKCREGCSMQSLHSQGASKATPFYRGCCITHYCPAEAVSHVPEFERRHPLAGRVDSSAASIGCLGGTQTVEMAGVWHIRSRRIYSLLRCPGAIPVLPLRSEYVGSIGTMAAHGSVHLVHGGGLSSHMGHGLWPSGTGCSGVSGGLLL